jgi:hypothetical protein
MTYISVYWRSTDLDVSGGKKDSHTSIQFGNVNRCQIFTPSKSSISIPNLSTFNFSVINQVDSFVFFGNQICLAIR